MAKQDIYIGITLGKRHIKQLQEFASAVEATTNKVKGLQQAVLNIGESTGGKSQKFSASALVSSLGEIKTAIVAIKDAKFENVSKAMEALNSAQLTNFANAVGLLKGNLDASLIQQITSFSTAIQAMGTAQGKFNGAMLVQDIKDLMTGLGKLNINANQTQNITNLKDALSGLSIPLNQNTISALSQLGFALRNIREYAEGKNVLTGLSTGIKQFAKLQEVDGLLHNVRKLASAANVLSRSEKLDFSNFTEGLKKVEVLNKELSAEQWGNIKAVATNIKNAFTPIDGMKLPNLSGLATAVQTLTAMEKDAQGNSTGVLKHNMAIFGQQLTDAAGHIEKAFTPLQHLKMPQIGGIAKNLDILSTATYNFKNIEAIVKRFKETLGTLHGLQMPNLNNFAKGLNELQKLKTGVSIRGILGDDIASLKKDLMGWENIKVPNLASFAKGLKDLAAGTLDTKTISENLKAIPNKLRWLTGIQVPDLSGFAKGIHELSRPTVDASKAATAIGAAIDAIHTKMANQKEIKFPSLATFAKGIKEFHVLAETGKTDEENLKKIIAPIKTLITELQGVGKVDLPNLNGIAVAIHKLSTAVPADAGTIAAGHITAITAAIKGLDKIQVPNPVGLATTFKTLNESTLRGMSDLKTKETTTTLQHNLDVLKSSLLGFKDIQVPNLTNIAVAFRNLDSAIAPGKKNRLEDGWLDINVKSIIAALKQLEEVQHIKLPGFTAVTKTFRELDSAIPSGKKNRLEEGWLDTNVVSIKTAIEDLHKVSNLKLPDLTRITRAFRDLDSAIPSGKKNRLEEGWITTNVKAIKDAIVQLNEVSNLKLPNITSITAAFRNLDSAIAPGKKNRFDSGWLNINIESIISAIRNLNSVESLSLPNLSNITKAFRELDSAIPSGKKNRLEEGWVNTNIASIREAILQLNEVSSLKLPDLTSITKAFRNLDSAIPSGKKTRIEEGWITTNVKAIKDAVTELHSVSALKMPNLTSITAAFRNLDSAIAPGKKTRIEDGWLNINVEAIISAINRLNTVSKVDLPNLSNIVRTFRELDSAIPTGKKTRIEEGWITTNVDSIKNAIVQLNEVSNLKLPDLTRITKSFRNLDSAIPSGKKNRLEEGWITINVASIKTAIEDLHKVSNLKLPDLTRITKSFRELDSAIPSGKKNRMEEGWITANVDSIKNAIVQLNEVSNLKLPDLARITRTFRDLDSAIPAGKKTRIEEGRLHQNVEEIKRAVGDLNEVSKLKLPNLTPITAAFRNLDSAVPTGKKNRMEEGWLDWNIEAIKAAVLKLGEVGKVPIPNLSGIAKAFRELDSAVPSGKKNRMEEGWLDTNVKAIKGAIEELKTFDKLKLPTLKNIADAFKILNDSPIKGMTYVTSEKKWFTNMDYNIEQIKSAITKLAEFDKLKLPDLKNVADAFNILGTIPKGMSQDNRIDTFKTNINTIISVLNESKEKLNKIQLPNLKNIADAFIGLATFKPRDLDITGFRANITEIKNALTQLYAISKDSQGKQFKLPNLEGIAKAFKVLNSEELKGSQNTFMFGQGGTASSAITRIKENVRAIVEALREFEGKNFDLPNINNLAAGLQKLNQISKINENLAGNMEKLKEGLEVLRGVQVPKQFKNFADGLHSLQEFSTKATGQLINDKLAQDLTALAKSLGQFTGITLPTNLQGFAKGIESVAKVNVADFTKNFNQLMQAMKGLNLDPNTTALDHLTAKLAVCAAGINAVENKLRQASASFAGFGGSTKPAEDGLSRLQERIKMFLQYRVISTLFNKITTAIQAIPNNIKEFEKSMYNVQSITGATDVTVAKLGTTVKEIASTTKFSAQEVADGMTMIAQAGFTAGQSMQMMQSISNLATGTLSDMKTVVDLVTSAMVVFNIESNDAARVSDVFANAVNKSKLTMDKIKTAFNYIGPVARDANVSFEESAVAMMLLANSGQKASTIGTGLRNVFSTLLSPSKKLTEAAAAVGVSLTDLDPRINSFKDVISNLGVVVRDSQVALDVFGKRGSTAVLSLTNGAKDYDRLYASVTRVGSAAEMAATQQEGLYVRWKNLTDRAQLLAVTLGQNGLTWAISKLVNAISGFINFLNKLNEGPIGKTILRFGLAAAAFTSFAAVLVSVRAIWAPFVASLTRGMVSIIGLFPKITIGGRAAAAGIAAMATAEQTGAAATITFGTALKSLLSVAWPIVLAITAISAAVSVCTVSMEGIELNLQKVSQNLDKISNQSQSVTDALEKITKLQPKTEEYANAIKSVMTAIADNKGPVVGAETEFRALQAAINETNDAFTDGGVALRRYGQRLKELAVVQASMALQDSAKLFESSMRTTGFHLGGYKYGGNITNQAKERYGLFIDEETNPNKVRNVDYDTARSIFSDVASGKVKREDVFNNKESYTDALNAFNTLNEQAETFINKMVDAGKISFHTSIDQVTRLAAALGATGTQLEAVKQIYIDLNRAAKERLFAGIEPSDVKESVQNVLSREIDGKKVSVEGTASFDISSAVLAGEEALATAVKEQVEGIKVDTDVLSKHMQETAVSLKNIAADTKGIDINIDADDVNKATEAYANIIRIHKAIEDARKQYADKLEKAESIEDPEARRLAVEKVNKEYNALLKTMTTINDQYLKERNTSENMASLTRGIKIVQDLELRIARINENTDAVILKNNEALREKLKEASEQFDKKGYAVIDGYRYTGNTEYNKAVKELVARNREANEAIKSQSQEMIKTITDSANAALRSVLQTSVPIEARVKEMLKEDKAAQKIRDIDLQKEMNRIHILEEAYKQSNGRIGLDFKQSRAAEQEAIAKHTAIHLAALAKIEEELKKTYKGNPELDKALEQITNKRNEVIENAYKSQFDLQQKYAKAAMFAAKEAGDKIEREAKRSSEVRKREQEKAMHEVSVLEAKGVLSHEKAEKRKIEISVKYHSELIDAYRKQIEDLKAVGAADNIQQIVKLEEEIAKSSYEVIKESRRGIEEQNKSIYESIKKLKEIQGSEDLSTKAGDFSVERQRAITEEYAKEIEKKKKLEKEGLDYTIEVNGEALSKVAEAVRKHYDKVDSIRSKSAERQKSIEEDIVKKQEDYEKKKLDIKQKYNKKELDLANELQDVYDQIDSGKGGKKLEQRRVNRATNRIKEAQSKINDAIKTNDKAALEAIDNQLKTDVNTLANSSKAKSKKGDIQNAFAMRRQILQAQKNIEIQEEDEKFQRDLKREKQKLNLLKSTAEEALLAENGRHELVMSHLEQEAQKARERVELAKEEIQLWEEAREKANIQAEPTPLKETAREAQEEDNSSPSNVPQKITKRPDGTYANVPPVTSGMMQKDEKGKWIPSQSQEAQQKQVTPPTQGKGALPTDMVGTWQRAVSQVIASVPGLSDEQRDKTLAYVEMVYGKAQEAIDAVQAASDTAVKATATTAQASAESATTALTTVQEKAKEAREDSEITKEKAEEHLSDSSKERVNASDPDKMAEAAKKAGLQVTDEGVVTNLYDPELTKKSAEEVERLNEDLCNRINQDAIELAKNTNKAIDDAVKASGSLIDEFVNKLNTVDTASFGNAFVDDFMSSLRPEAVKASIDELVAALNEQFKEINIEELPITVNAETAITELGAVKSQADSLIKEAYRLVVEGKVDEAIRNIKAVKAELDTLKDKKVTITIEKVEKDSTGGSVGTYATGGQVYRRLQSRFINTGSGNKDDVPALLMKNEFVHRAAAVKKYGVDFMYKLNNLQIPKSITQMFASGGLVSNAFGAVHRFANGGLIRSTKRKLEELFAGSGVNLNVDNLNITGKMEEAANQFTSPIGLQAMGMLAKNIESSISKFVVGGPTNNAALTSAQIQTISAAYSSSIAKAQASGNAAIAQALTEERKRLYDLSDELQMILASLNEEYNEEARKLNQEHQQKLREKKEEYEKNVEEENTSYAERVESDTKSHKKEDEDYVKSKAERDENYHTSLQELRDSLEKDRLDYEAGLLSKRQAVIERQNAMTQFRNQLSSEKYPAGSNQHKNASLLELMQAHAAYAKELYGSDRMYIIDLGGTVQRVEESEDIKKIKLQKAKEAIRPVSKSEKNSLNRLATIAYNSPAQYSKGRFKALDDYWKTVNDARGWTAYRQALAEYEGTAEVKPVEQSIPYYTYLLQHLRSDFTLPLEQAQIELKAAMKEDNPDVKVSKEIAKLTKEYREASDEAEESRLESLEERKKSIEERETSHKDRLAELKKDYDSFVEEENKTYQESLEKLKEETETKTEEAKAGNYENIQIVKSSTAEIIENAKNKMRSSVAVARSDKERWLKDMQASAREQADSTAQSAYNDGTMTVPQYTTSSANFSQPGGFMAIAQSYLSGLDIDELLKRLKGGVLKFAKGGLVPFLTGAKPNTDSVLSMLSPHEFVMSAKAVKAFGVNFMNSLNNLRIPAFATGGMVGASTPVSAGAIDKIMNKTVYALDLTLNNTHIGELMGEKDTIDSFMNVMNRARMGIA